MRSRRVAWFSSVAVLMLALQVNGCWCNPPKPEVFNNFPVADPADPRDYCAAWAPTECAFAERCEPATRAALDENGGCNAGMTVRCNERYATYLAGIEAGRTTYDGYLARGCLSERGNRGCDDEEPAVCGRVFGGGVKQGQPCTIDLECADGLFCSGGPESCGVCVDRAGAGGPCWSDSSCEASTRCVDGNCTPVLNAGAPCFGKESLCSSSTFCPIVPPGIPFPPEYQGLITCQNIARAGATCEPLFGFIQVPCATGLTCLATDGGHLCFDPAGEGEACDAMGRTAPTCAGQGVRTYCDAVSHLCTTIRVVGSGEACGSSAVCNEASQCVNGTCAERPREGDACTSSGTEDPCFESHCVDGNCRAPGLAGSSCDEGCAAGLVCVDGRCGAAACDGGVAWDAGPRVRDGGVPDAG